MAIGPSGCCETTHGEPESRSRETPGPQQPIRVVRGRGVNFRAHDLRPLLSFVSLATPSHPDLVEVTRRSPCAHPAICMGRAPFRQPPRRSASRSRWGAPKPIVQAVFSKRSRAPAEPPRTLPLNLLKNRSSEVGPFSADLDTPDLRISTLGRHWSYTSCLAHEVGRCWDLVDLRGIYRFPGPR